MKNLVVLVLGIFLLVACSSNDDEKTAKADNFDRATLLTNWADNIIIPSYLNYQSKVAILLNDANSFTTTPSEANLQTLRTSWYEAYKAYQYVSIYSFGKAEEIGFKEISNTFPANTAGIEANISSGSYNLNLQTQYAKQGLPGLDYLLNGLGSDDTTIVSFYTTNTNAANYKKYITTVVEKLKTTVDVVVTDWKSGFRDSYVKNTGTSVSGAVNITTNNFVKNLEKDIRTVKVGIASGIFSNGVKYPEKTEALYKGDVSKELLTISLSASKDFYNGKHFGSTTSGSSLKSYLDFVNAVRDNQKLSDLINTQYVTINTTIASLNNSIAEQINTDNSKVIAVNDAIQKNVLYTKLDMMQALNITIDYVDGDGD